jgi:uncharacterized membrane protein YbhN (UPF0104 family)
MTGPEPALPGNSDPPSARTEPLWPESLGALYIGRRSDFIHRHRHVISLIVLVVSLLTFVVLFSIAGSSAVTAAFHHLAWWFIPVTLAAHVVAYGGYLVAHHQIANRSGVPVGWRRGAQLMVIGFGGWLPGGGFSVDRRALEAAGIERTDASVSAIALGLLELVVLTPVAWVCALALFRAPGISGGYTLPWLLAVPAGFIFALTTVPFTRVPPARSGRVRRAVGQLGAATRACLALLSAPRRGGWVLIGIGIYWAADLIALWAALAFLSIHLSTDLLILAYATGYVLTRRTLPFAGAAVIETLLTVSLVAAGVPLASAAMAVFIYRMSDFGLTLVAALGASSMAERSLRFVVADGGSSPAG